MFKQCMRYPRDQITSLSGHTRPIDSSLHRFTVKFCRFSLRCLMKDASVQKLLSWWTEKNRIDLVSFALYLFSVPQKPKSGLQTNIFLPLYLRSALLTLLLHDLTCGANPTACDDFSAVSSDVSTLAAADDAAAERQTLAQLWSCLKRSNSAFSSHTYDKSTLLEYYLLLTNQSNRPTRPSLDKLWHSSALTYYAGEHHFYTQSLI